MGIKSRKGSFLNDDDAGLFLDSVDIDEFEEEQFERAPRGRGRHKARRAKMVRNRFSDYEGERWLKKQVRDWDSYDIDDDEEDFSWLASDDID